jgi:tetratricopeptide (TPR) repeat protein
MGHYEVLNGYDDSRGRFIAQDSYIQPDLPVPYEELERYWRHFNYTYVVIYQPEREAEVMALLGPQADEAYNFQWAAQKASDEIYSLEGDQRYYAWYNRGSSLVKLQDFAGAAEAYDQAFALYPDIPEKERPWRILWYQTGPYFAYYYSGRYYDVINLATTTLANMSEPAIEESFYWRAMARAATGDVEGAVEDYRTSLEWHPGFEPSVYQLQLLGVEP